MKLILSIVTLCAAFAASTACTRFRLWDARNNVPFEDYLIDGDFICKRDLPIRTYDPINIEADITNCDTNGYNHIKVQLVLQGPCCGRGDVYKRWEGRAPYSLYGDKDRDANDVHMNGYVAETGDYIIHAKVVGKNAAGEKKVLDTFRSNEIQFRIDLCLRPDEW